MTNDQTTVRTAHRVLDAQDAASALAALYGVRPLIAVGEAGIGIGTRKTRGFPEPLGHDIGDLIGADMQPHVDSSLFASWHGEGSHDGRYVQVAVSIPPIADGSGR
ncbi:hypothetical protein [Streptomyces daliensis]|uniref:Uncharacterized protein n=1 Tax=Streptomyces daliensis TaxID=299421 RepID=A0A8T4IJY3_9ACTN|nr:hypothetical protein [Streptomyces daliensis]